jgi:outer membrane receptor for Fe3+-dicitrate
LRRNLYSEAVQVSNIKHLLSAGRFHTFPNNSQMPTNATYASTAVIGSIPAYYVMDVTTSYTYKWFKLSCSVNNLSNNKYFTRRAESYPGPGIIPSDGIGVFGTIAFKWHTKN